MAGCLTVYSYLTSTSMDVQCSQVLNVRDIYFQSSNQKKGEGMGELFPDSLRKTACQRIHSRQVPLKRLWLTSSKPCLPDNYVRQCPSTIDRCNFHSQSVSRLACFSFKKPGSAFREWNRLRDYDSIQKNLAVCKKWVMEPGSNQYMSLSESSKQKRIISVWRQYRWPRL